MRSILLVPIFACCATAAPPYRFLLAIGNQWDDDSSYLTRWKSSLTMDR
jgi:hypothetical protein